MPFLVAAPVSTFDLDLESGEDIPIEQRDPGEVLNYANLRTAEDGAEAYNPAFDVTPAELITALVTDRGAVRAPDAAKVRGHLQS